MLKSGLLVRKFRATFGDFPDINRPETTIATPSTSEPYRAAL
jgi:hypothetical protein